MKVLEVKPQEVSRIAEDRVERSSDIATSLARKRKKIGEITLQKKWKTICSLNEVWLPYMHNNYTSISIL